MKAPKNFIPNKKLKHKLDYSRREDSKENYQALAIAAGIVDVPSPGSIYVWMPGMEEAKRVMETYDWVNSLCFFNNKLYYTLNKNIFRFPEERMYYSEEGAVYALCEYDGQLMHAGASGKIKNTSTQKEYPIDFRGYIYDLCEYNGALLACGMEGIKEAGTNILRAEKRERTTRTICVFEKNLYDAGEYRRIYQTLEDGLIAKRDESSTRALRVFDRKLIDGTGDVIYNTLTDEKLLKVGETPFNWVITALEPIPRKFMQELLAYANTK